MTAHWHRDTYDDYWDGVLMTMAPAWELDLVLLEITMLLERCSERQSDGVDDDHTHALVVRGLALTTPDMGVVLSIACSIWRGLCDLISCPKENIVTEFFPGVKIFPYDCRSSTC